MRGMNGLTNEREMRKKNCSCIYLSAQWFSINLGVSVCLFFFFHRKIYSILRQDSRFSSIITRASEWTIDLIESQCVIIVCQILDFLQTLCIVWVVDLLIVFRWISVSSLLTLLRCEKWKKKTKKWSMPIFHVWLVMNELTFAAL